MPKVVNITERHQAVVAARDYDAFGQVLSESGDWGDSDFGFHPNWLQLKGVAGGRYYLTPGGRVYDTCVGRYLQRDPVAVAGDNLYAALADNPNKYVDPSGFTQEYTYPQVAAAEIEVLRWQGRLAALLAQKAVEEEKRKGAPLPPDSPMLKDIKEKEAYLAKFQALLQQAKARQARWNRFDQDIERIVKDINASSFAKYSKDCPPGTPQLDPNLVKALIFSETEMGTGEAYVRRLQTEQAAYERWQAAHAEWSRTKTGEEPKLSKFTTYQLWHLNIGRATDPAVFESMKKDPDFVSLYDFPDSYANVFAGGSETDIKIAVAALMIKLECVCTEKKLRKDIWLNTVKAYKGFTAEGGRKATLVWNLYTEGKHPYKPEWILWQKKPAGK